MNNPYENQQHYPAAQPHTQQHHRRKRGCLTWLLIAGMVMAAPMLLCGVLTLGFLLLPPPPIDILVIGMDSRGNEGAVARTDSIMVINVNADTVAVNVLSIPRGLFVDVPNYGSQMINTANFLGEVEQAGNGIPLLESTIEYNFGIQIDRYVRMDFAGFESLVDAVGGVYIDVPYVVEDFSYPTADYGTIHIRFEPGYQWMDGETALIYARTRHGDDDYRRAERQQQVASAFVSRAINPLTWAGLISALNQSVETNLSVLDLVTLAPTSVFNSGHFNQLVIDRDYILAGSKGPIPDYAKLAPFISEHFD